MCQFVGVCICMWAPPEAWRGRWFPRSWNTGGCEPSDVNAGSWFSARVSSLCSWLQVISISPEFLKIETARCKWSDITWVLICTNIKDLCMCSICHLYIFFRERFIQIICYLSYWLYAFLLLGCKSSLHILDTIFLSSMRVVFSLRPCVCCSFLSHSWW